MLPMGSAACITIAVMMAANVGCQSSRSHLAGNAVPPSSQSKAIALDAGAAKSKHVKEDFAATNDTTKVRLIALEIDKDDEPVDGSSLPDAAHLPDADESRSKDAITLVNDAALNAASPLTVDACVQIALVSHPKIIAARYRVQAAQNRVPQARSLEDPMLSNDFFPIPGNAQQTAAGRMQDTIGLSQNVPWPEKLKARAAVACREAQIAQAEVESIEREITEAVQLAYFELWFAQRGSEILIENQNLVDDLIRVAEARYTSGGSQQDVLNAEIERERLSQRLLELAGQRAAAEAELAAYLQQPQSLAISTSHSLALDDLPTQLAELIALAEQCNPELRGLGLQVQRDFQKQRLANLQRYPDFQLGTQYGFMTRSKALSPFADGVDNISFSVGVTLPIYRNKIQGGINEAAAIRASTTKLYESERLTLEGRLRRLIGEVDAIDQQRTLFRDRIVPRAEQALEIALSEYTVGKTTFVQLTDNYTELLNYQLQIVRLDSMLATKLAQIERIIGCNPGY